MKTEIKKGLGLNLTVVQCDTRPISLKYVTKELNFDECLHSEAILRSINGDIVNQPNFWSMSSAINRIKAGLIGAKYLSFTCDESNFPDRHVTWGKIDILIKVLKNAKTDEVICFLDSDAWIRDERILLKMVQSLYDNPEKHVVLSRDPHIPVNSFINSGCMIFKNTPYCNELLEHVWNAVESEQYENYRHEWPCEQYVLSDIVKAEYDKFYICKVSALNTPCGEIVRHSWWKNMLPELLDDACRECVFKLADSRYDLNEGTEYFDINNYLDCTTVDMGFDDKSQFSEDMLCSDSTTSDGDGMNTGFRINPDGLYHVQDFSHFHDNEFLQAAYLAVLRRSPDPLGEKYYLDKIRGGASRVRILAQLLKSSEAEEFNTKITGLWACMLFENILNMPIIGTILSIPIFFLSIRSHLKNIRTLENTIIGLNVELTKQHEDYATLKQSISDISLRQRALDNDRDNLAKSIPVTLRKITRDITSLQDKFHKTSHSPDDLQKQTAAE
jgi:cell division protein FtsL